MESDKYIYHQGSFVEAEKITASNEVEPKVSEFYHPDRYYSEKSERKEQERQEMKEDRCE